MLGLLRAQQRAVQQSVVRMGSTGPSKKQFSTKLTNESFLTTASGDYVESQYHAWKRDPNSVHASWAAFFHNVDQGKPVGTAFVAPPTLMPSSTATTTAAAPANQYLDNLRVVTLINAYRSLGHKIAKLDPLGLAPAQHIQELDVKHYGFSDADLSKEFYFSDTKSFPFNGYTLAKIVDTLKETYSSTIAAEFSHIEDTVQREWVRQRLEANVRKVVSNQDKSDLMERLIWSDKFERFLMTKFGQDKRFGLDGCETLIPGMKALIDTAGDLGVESVVIGMPHRGRLNVLGNVIRKPLEDIFREFSKMPPEDLKKDFVHSGDVKYHLGTSFDRTTKTGKRIHLSLMSNPSHLEAVNPLVEGKTRAKQNYMNDTVHDKVMALQLHGDAAFAGQGIVYETMQMAGLRHFSTGGTIHIVVNNQIGFTTDPYDSRHTEYCTDIAKAFEIPIFHVNGDDPEAVVAVSHLAAEFRQTFKKGCVIDIVAYRRFGHNELDEPRYTQPLMYGVIGSHPSTLSLYKTKLQKEGVMTEDQINQIEKQVENSLQTAFQHAPATKAKPSSWLESKWKNFKGPEQLARIMNTAVPVATLKNIGHVISTPPGQDFHLHQTIARDLKKRSQMFETGHNIDWATGEALAFGSLLLEGNHVRISGQDVERGTFSHRHAVVHCQKTGKEYTALSNLSPNQATFVPANSLLSEYGVLGFELGYSLENPNALVIWEGQFGDFANGAQIIIDQFLSSGEQKWYRQSGLVMLLPHGYDGQGPEHSSARLERFLQLCDSDPNKIPEMDPSKTRQTQEINMQVVNVTTPANYFHVLRRQVHREFRKPLIVMSPKSLLRHPLCKSNLSDFTENSRFQRVIPETSEDVRKQDPKSIRKVIFCSGKVYYDLVQHREDLEKSSKHKILDTAIVRVEQLCPFPFDLVQDQLRAYPNAQVVWCQEEPMNQGAWNFVYHHMVTCLKATSHSAGVPKYVGRPVSASPAAGTLYTHKVELEKFLNEAFS